MPLLPKPPRRWQAATGVATMLARLGGVCYIRFKGALGLSRHKRRSPSLAGLRLLKRR